jgi:signal transduction histidine kinase
MFIKLFNFFIPPVYRVNPEDYRHAKINILFYLINALGLTLNTYTGVLVDFPPFIYLNLIFATISIGLAFLIRAGFSFTVCATITTIFGFFYVNFIIYNMGGISSSTIFGLLFYALYFLFLSNKTKQSVVWMAISMLNLTAYYMYNLYFSELSINVDLENIKSFNFMVLFSQCATIFILVIIFQKQKDKAVGELIEINGNLKKAQAQLIQSEKLASLGELTAGIAHEIQNPLNFVNNFSELSIDLAKEIKEKVEKRTLIPDGRITIKDKKYLEELINDLNSNQEKINFHGKRASSIVKGMLEHSSTSTGVKELTDINKLADEYLRLSYHGLRAKDKTFNSDYTTEFDENLPKISVIPQDIGRVILNLINNAFWAVKTIKKPLVIVKTEQKDNQIIIKVSDNGTGMSEATKAKIFQPFFTTKPTGQGTGLGLSLSYDIITKGHGGSIDVKSVEGEGTEFIVKLPIV